MSKTYRTPVVASLGNADVLTQIRVQPGPHKEAVQGSTTSLMLDL
jgi:hypothetical protein